MFFFQVLEITLNADQTARKAPSMGVYCLFPSLSVPRSLYPILSPSLLPLLSCYFLPIRPCVPPLFIALCLVVPMPFFASSFLSSMPSHCSSTRTPRCTHSSQAASLPTPCSLIHASNPSYSHGYRLCYSYSCIACMWCFNLIRLTCLMSSACE